MRYMEEMKRVNRILAHPRFQIYKEEIKKWEEDRPFCGHDVSHLLDVARIACILSLEEKCEVSKEYIYTAALLHDIGIHEAERKHGSSTNRPVSKSLPGFLRTVDMMRKRPPRFCRLWGITGTRPGRRRHLLTG